MSSTAIPVVSTLAALVELTAKLGRQRSVHDIAKILRSSVKWMLPTEYASLILRRDDGAHELWPEGRSIELPYHVETVLLTHAALEPQDPRQVADALGISELRSLMILPLGDGERILGVLILGSHDPRAFQFVDRGTCHLLALAVASAVRTTQLLASEQAARQTAELAIAARNKLIGTVTHDLRNPLGVVMTLFEMAVDDGRVPTDDIVDVRGALARMRALIDDMLDLARTESGMAGQLVLQRKPLDLVALVHVAARTGRAALVPGQLLFVDQAVDALIADLDEQRMIRVLENLVSNAIKYSPHGGEIHVAVSREPEHARVVVRDQGLGIPAAHIPLVFERFKRAANVAEIRGTGLGLASVREIVVAHGGEIRVDSVEGQGSTFTVDLPLTA